MIALSFLTVAFASIAVAQDTSVKAIEAHFSGAGLVPSFLETFNPSALLTLNYAGVGDITPGQSLKKEQVSVTPAVTVTPANSTVQFSGKYTLAMVDAGNVGADESSVTRHWLVNGVTVESNKVANDSAVAITQYAGPYPAAGSGVHRYVVLLYTQPDSFKAPDGFAEPNMGVSTFNFADYVKNSGLGALVAANYIDVEEGTATASVSATSAVVSSTLAPASSGSSGTGTKTSSSAGTPSASQSGTNNNGASAQGASVFMLVSIVAAAAFMA